MEMTGGQALAQSLKLEGVQTLFALPGIQLDYLFDAIWEERDHYEVFHARHEQATAYMADGFARSTGQIGTFVVVPGPGVLNASAALSTAYACSSPVLCVTGQIDSSIIDQGRGALHEIHDQPGLLSHLTKSSERAMHPTEIPGMVQRAVRELRSGRPRPVSIEVPPDVLGTVADVTLLEPDRTSRAEEHADSDALERAAELLGKAERPLICAGGGVLTAEAWEEVRALSEMLDAPVLMTSNGRGILSDRDPRAFSGRVATPALVPNADAILAIGTRFALAANMGAGATPVNGKLIQADVDAEEIGRNHPADVALVGDAKFSAAELLQRIPKHNRARASREAEFAGVREKHWQAMNSTPWQRSMAQAIRDVLPDDAIVVSESTQVGYHVHGGGFEVYEPRTLFTSGYQGTLGYGFATALGVAVGNPDKPVVSINGDGGFMYNVQELSTQAKFGIPLVTLVFNDNMYGNVRRIQSQRYNGHTIASDLKNPNLAKVAEEFGVAGFRAKTPDELRKVLREALDLRAPALIEVEQPPTPELEAPAPMTALPARPVLNL
ncbi:MAG: thiamine pyrophosphate-binding protein [Dehalococcoidia bacterium]|nr:thiamine pyrophosphate-binding protein [Dehalococcoidia bacterium]MCB9482369.1 thiamine pyrophosphate-binding protein [Dehalococcoidia bacterium]MCB9490778.1 thiamine pyrophosphate-binding protein [Dehalococcoidia bacterium]